MDSFSKCVFVGAGKHTSVHDMHPHSIIKNKNMLLYCLVGKIFKNSILYISMQIYNNPWTKKNIKITILNL